MSIARTVVISGWKLRSVVTNKSFLTAIINCGLVPISIILYNQYNWQPVMDEFLLTTLQKINKKELNQRLYLPGLALVAGKL